MKLKTITLVAFLAFFAAEVFSQDFKTDCEKISKVFTDSRELSIDMTLRGYSSENDRTGTAMGKAVLRKSRESYYSKYDDSEMICDGTSTLLIDHKERSIVRFPNTMQERSVAQIDKQFQDAVNRTDSIFVVEESNGIRTWGCMRFGGIISRTNITFEIETGHLVKIEYWYRPDDKSSAQGMYKITINYTSIQTNVKDKSVFSTQRVLKTANGKYVPKSKYEGYHVEDVKP